MNINIKAIGSSIVNGTKVGADHVVRGVKATPDAVKVVGNGTVRGVKATPDAAKVVGRQVQRVGNIRVTTKDQLPRNRRVSKAKASKKA